MGAIGAMTDHASESDDGSSDDAESEEEEDIEQETTILGRETLKGDFCSDSRLFAWTGISMYRCKGFEQVLSFDGAAFNLLCCRACSCAGCTESTYCAGYRCDCASQQVI